MHITSIALTFKRIKFCLFIKKTLSINRLQYQQFNSHIIYNLTANILAFIACKSTQKWIINKNEKKNQNRAVKSFNQSVIGMLYM